MNKDVHQIRVIKFIWCQNDICGHSKFGIKMKPCGYNVPYTYIKSHKLRLCLDNTGRNYNHSKLVHPRGKLVRHQYIK